MALVRGRARWRCRRVEGVAFEDGTLAADRARGAPHGAGPARRAGRARRGADAPHHPPRDARGRVHVPDRPEAARWLSEPSVRGHPLAELTLCASARAAPRAGGRVLGLRVPRSCSPPSSASRSAAVRRMRCRSRWRRGRMPRRDARPWPRATGSSRACCSEKEALAALGRGRVVLVVSAGDPPTYSVRSHPAREPGRAPRGGRRAAARRAGARTPSPPAAARDHRAGLALHRLPGPRPARHEPHGHRHVGHRLLAGGRAQRQAPEAAGGGADAARPDPAARRSSRGSSS